MIGYDDIIDMEYVPRDDPGRLTRQQRAAQFNPFAAVRGHAEAIEEKNRSRLSVPRPDLSEDELAELDRRLGLLMTREELRQGAEITFFVPDKSGDVGTLQTTVLNIRRIDLPRRILTTVEGKDYSLMDIVKIRFAEEVNS